MNPLRKINSRLIIISLVFMVIFISATSGLMNIMLDNVIQLTVDVHYNQVISQLDKEIDLLKSTTEKIATNEKIISLLDTNRSVDQLTEEDKQSMMDQIDNFEKVLESSPFVGTVNIVSLSGDYMFSRGTLYKTFNLTTRPWFKAEYLTNDYKSIVTDLHYDYSTGQETIGIVSFIHSDQQEFLGAAVLDVFVDELIKYANSTFDSGELKTFLTEISNDDNIEINPEEYYIKEHYGLLDNTRMIFAFNKESIKQSSLIDDGLLESKIATFVIGAFVAIALGIGIKLAFKPALRATEKLRHLMGNLGVGEASLEDKDEFKQLEIISDSIGKSFDDKIQSLIYYDGLTNLPNRKKMKNLCADLIDEGQPFAFVFVDLNKFKMINDVFGHSVGDLLLITFSQRMQKALGDRGIITRYSGDEFIVLYKNFEGDDQFVEFYQQKILSCFEHPIQLTEEVKTKIQFSMGVAVYPRDGKTVEDLINKSDFMMYKNKKDRVMDKVFFFNDEVYQDMLYIETLKEELKNVIKTNELRLVYQPIVDATGTIQKAEVLIRWQNAKLGWMSPLQFIHYAEETREIIPIGYWIINEVCRFIKENQLTTDISINISPIQLMEIDFYPKVDEILKQYEIPYHQICFEITESVLLGDSDIVIKNIDVLRKSGIKIALDDFGTGYSSFAYLTKYPIDILKIDKIFLDNASSNEFQIIGYINKIAKVLKMQLVIEGVETEDQLKELVKIDCNLFQGYYFYRPLIPEDFLEAVNKYDSQKYFSVNVNE
ncbi:MAG: EAL domain-containing protein [Turicibacter sp.]|nr:EAL domain-containing protein [Turicibacter sp.]